MMSIHNKKRSEWRRNFCVSLLLCFGLLSPASHLAAETLPSFPKPGADGGTLVPPNVLLLIDNSGSMNFSMNEDHVMGDGTKPYQRSGNRYWFYYGRDLNPGVNAAGNNFVGTLPDDAIQEELPAKFKMNYNYHPNLVYIPYADLRKLPELSDLPSNASESAVEAAVRNLRAWVPVEEKPVSVKVFAEYEKDSKELSPSKYAELIGAPAALFSPFKYPNDSRMYILKNVIYRLLHDKSIYEGLRIGLSGYYQHFERSMTDTNSWARWLPHHDDYDRWFDNVQKHFWYGTSDSNDRGARLFEPILDVNYKITDNVMHIDHLRQWFDGEDHLVYNSSNSLIRSREFRSVGATPLEKSIFQKADPPVRSSANHIFKKNYGVSQTAFPYLPKSLLDNYKVITDYCQQNWLVILTDGADTWDNVSGSDTVKAVRDLVKEPMGETNGEDNKKISAFVIGFVDEVAQSALAAVLNKAAKAGRPDLDDIPEEDRPGAYMADSMETLFSALRSIFSEIHAIAYENYTGGAPLISPPSSSAEEMEVYVPWHTLHEIDFEKREIKKNDPAYTQLLPYSRFAGRLEKRIRTTDDDDEIYYKKVWDASEKFTSEPWTERTVYTAFQGLDVDKNNLSEFKEENAVQLSVPLGLSETETPSFIRWLLGKDEFFVLTNDGKLCYEYSLRENDDEEKRVDDILFDFNHSGLVKVGPPSGGILGETYDSFRAIVRDPIVYVQSNAGMLHAFLDTNDKDNGGKEVFAFIPPNVLSGGRLAGLRLDSVNDFSETPVFFPKYLLNGPLVAEDVFLKSKNGYRTVLFGLSGPGGPGMYMLDVTDPQSPSMLWTIENSVYETIAGSPSFSGEIEKRKVLHWDSSAAFQLYPHPILTDGHKYDYRLLRRTIGKPVIKRFFSGSEWEWVFLLGSGLAAGFQGDAPSGALYVGKVEDGSIIEKFDAVAPVTSQIVAPHNQSNVYAELIHFLAGDAVGSVYKGEYADDWKWQKVLEFPNTSSSKNGGVFRGINAFLLRNELWLFAGTGDVLEYLPEPEGDYKNYFASVNLSTLKPEDEPFQVGSSEKLTKLDIQVRDDDGDYEHNLQRSGWYLELSIRETAGAKNRETMATTPLLYRNEYIIFATYIPSNSNDPCVQAGLGDSRLYFLQRKSGKAPDWDRSEKYIEFPNLKITGIAIGNDDLVISATGDTSVTPVGKGADALISIENLHTNDELGLKGVEWNLKLDPYFWKSR